MSAAATYSAEDDKIRLYVGRVPREDYDALRAAGFVATPKQTCDFVAPWTPAREDLALSFLDDDQDIEDEDYSPEERAADRAERFGGYRDRRTTEAVSSADRFDAGPSAHGFADPRRAERAARRHDRIRTGALSQWSRAEYWQQRTAGVIAHALYRSSAPVRRSRILRLEADARRAPSPRWSEHIAHRLTYERAMLAQEGGTAADAEMERGGWLGKHQIHKVNRSPVTGLVVSVTLRLPGDRWGNTSEGHHMRAFNIQRLPEGAYRAPTDEERAAFAETTKQRKAEAKAVAPKAPPLVNPTDADAERLQAVWNAQAEYPASVRRLTQAQYSAASGGSYSGYETEELCSHGREPRRQYGRNIDPAPVVCKVRRAPGGQYGSARSVVVLVDKPRKPLPFDWTEVEHDPHRVRNAIAADLFPRMGEIAALVRASWKPTKGTDDAALFLRAERGGLIDSSSESQFWLTDAGRAALARWEAEGRPEWSPIGIGYHGPHADSVAVAR